jgi:hypothetical protein
LDVELGAVKQPVKRRLVRFPESTPEWCPAAAFGFNELAEGWQGLAHGKPSEGGSIEGCYCGRIYQHFVDVAIRTGRATLSA